MSLSTRSHQQPNADAAATADEAATAEGPISDAGLLPDGPPERTPDATSAGNDATDGRRPTWRDRHPATARALAHATTALSIALVLLALLLPNQLILLTPSQFVRIPVEGIFGAALLLALPPKARRVASVFAGAGLGLLTVLNLLDIGFNETLGRGFNPVFDWVLLDDGESFLQDSIGRTKAIGVAIGALALVLALLVLMTLAAVRLTNLMARHSATATRTTLGLGTVWVVCTALGVQVAGVPIAAESAAGLVQNRAQQVRASLEDEQAFAKEAAADAFRDTPGDQLLTGLRGKDVIFTFIESYGRSAIEDPLMAPGVDAALADGTKQLRAAGYSARSGWLTSATYGGGSWLGHSTFMSGLWIDNQQRYRTLTAGDHLTLTSAFKRTGAWRTVGIMPGLTKGWPEASFYGLDHVYGSRDLGYKGPKFSWSTMPDQYALSAFERLEHGRTRGKQRATQQAEQRAEQQSKPLMSFVILTSSHNPWAPLPKTIGWDEIGDGSVYNDIKEAGKNPVDVWKRTDQVRTEYGKSIQYSLHSLISYLQKYGTKNTVLVFLGDHQPVAKVSGDHASRDVPVTLVAHDPAVLKRISDWQWTPGLKPGPKAPVWRMDTFRDRFLTAYGPRSGSTPSRPAR
ncbi:sulfatase-like hydrolase/transferase [Streptomyces piniterrae]|uniref:sulfatase-like hydrolase/transferase n=1 Tax=Streptomyces piniterrae TaxID=2571125 RepID=UPI001FEBC65D|nr:sulfatase-like hydrolase/transferase [Streptomyces piniterrae]